MERQMKRKVAFWVFVILVNAVIGVVSVRTYQKLEARVAGIETYQKILGKALFEDYDRQLDELTLAQKKTVTQLLRALGVDGKYDFNNNLTKFWDLNKFFEHKVYAGTSVVLEVSDEMKELSADLPKKLTKVGAAPAVIIGRYVLMASHTNDVEFFSRQEVRMSTPFGVVKLIVPLKVLEYKVALLMPDGLELPLRELYRNKEKDFSLFEIYASRAMPTVGAGALNFPFEIGKSNELKVGNFIYMNGRPRINSEVARPGFVTSLLSASLDGSLGVKKDNNQFGLSQSVDSGDSGSPIVAFRDGRPELVGILLGFAYKTDDDNSRNIRASALKINITVDEIKAKLGIDLRELQLQILNKY